MIPCSRRPRSNAASLQTPFLERNKLLTHQDDASKINSLDGGFKGRERAEAGRPEMIVCARVEISQRPFGWEGSGTAGSVRRVQLPKRAALQVANWFHYRANHSPVGRLQRF